MAMISTRTHGIIDYVFGVFLIAAPYLLGFANGGPAQWVPTLVGLVIILTSLITDYEYSLAKLVPMPVHLTIDVIGGVLLLISPWLFGFATFVFWPHVVLGIIEIATPLMTSTTPSTAMTSVPASDASRTPPPGPRP